MKKTKNNSNLHAAKKAKNDEFYTRLCDIENECWHYKDQFRDKVIYCNCDDARESYFFKYFFLNFKEFGLKKLICTGYKKDGHGILLETEVGDADENGIIDPGELNITEMKGDGDFRSEECVALLQEADIVVTNPPFSLFREYIAQLVEYDKKFLIIGNINALKHKEVFPLIKNNKMWLGVNNVKEFVQADDSLKKFGNICWCSNLEHEKRHEELILVDKYDPKKYPKYDNYDAINVDKTSDIPMDYTGVMGVPITFLDKYCPSQFEIVGELNNGGDNEFDFAKPIINKKQTYARILIRLSKYI